MRTGFREADVVADEAPSSSPSTVRLLTDFLRERRKRLSPLREPTRAADNRNGPKGLRRADVAELAGISESWYALFERGARRDISSDTIMAIARALQLNADDVAYLCVLVGHRPPEGHGARDAVVLDRLISGRAAVALLHLSRDGTVIDADGLIAFLMGYATTAALIGRNVFCEIFLSTAVRERFVEWETFADYAVRVLRFVTAELGSLPAFFGCLRHDPAFADRWNGSLAVQRPIGLLPRQTLCVDVATNVTVDAYVVRLTGGERLVHVFGAATEDDDVLQRLASRFRP